MSCVHGGVLPFGGDPATQEGVAAGLARLHNAAARHAREPIEQFCDSLLADLNADVPPTTSPCWQCESSPSRGPART